MVDRSNTISVNVMTQEQRDGMTKEGDKRIISFSMNRTLHLVLTVQTYYHYTRKDIPCQPYNRRGTLRRIDRDAVIEDVLRWQKVLFVSSKIYRAREQTVSRIVWVRLRKR